MAKIHSALILDDDGNPLEINFTGQYYTIEWRMVASDVCVTKWTLWKFGEAGNYSSLSFVTIQEAFERIESDANCKLYETLGGSGVYQPSNTTKWQVRFVKTNNPPFELSEKAPWRIGISDFIGKKCKSKKRKSKKD